MVQKQRGVKVKKHFLIYAACVAALSLVLGVRAAARWQNNPPVQKPNPKEKVVSKASGTFEVKVIPQIDDKVGDPGVSRMSLDKQFHGDLEGSSKGQMLAVSTEVQGSAGYVAMERVNGTLRGHSGTFALQHSGTMNRGAPELTITVVPDSGTGELSGIDGKMKINIVDGKHFYEFDYSLPESR